MAILQSCCCWRSLRKGSYASAAYTLAYFMVIVVIMSGFLVEERQYLLGNTTAPQSQSLLEPETISPTSMTFNIILLGCGMAGVITCVLLLFGLYRDNRVLLIPWILIVIATTVVDLAHAVFLFALETTNFNPMTAILFTLDFFLLSLNIYCLLCVVSQYQEYKAGRGTAGHDELDRIPPIRYAAQPTGTSCLSTRRAATYHETRATPTQSPTIAHTSLPGESSDSVPRLSVRKHVQFGGDVPPADTGDFLHVHWKQSHHTQDSSHSSECNEDGDSVAPPSSRWASSKGAKPPALIVDTEPLIHPVSPSSPNGKFFENK